VHPVSVWSAVPDRTPTVVLAAVGRTGAGKSQLLKILASSCPLMAARVATLSLAEGHGSTGTRKTGAFSAPWDLPATGTLPGQTVDMLGIDTTGFGQLETQRGKVDPSRELASFLAASRGTVGAVLVVLTPDAPSHFGTLQALDELQKLVGKEMIARRTILVVTHTATLCSGPHLARMMRMRTGRAATLDIPSADLAVDGDAAYESAAEFVRRAPAVALRNPALKRTLMSYLTTASDDPETFRTLLDRCGNRVVFVESKPSGADPTSAECDVIRGLVAEACQNLVFARVGLYSPPAPAALYLKAIDALIANAVPPPGPGSDLVRLRASIVPGEPVSDAARELVDRAAAPIFRAGLAAAPK
jgi:hypothetical protein